jgi:branched-chain amino acid transport system substrate-binding protein
MHEFGLVTVLDLEREAMRGKPVKGTVFGGVQFLPNRQMQPHYVMFKVVDGKNANLEAMQ